MVLCSRKIKKLYNINLSKTEHIDLLPLGNLYAFYLKESELVILVCLNIFRDVERLYPTRGVRLSTNASFGPENKKLIKKLLVLELQNFYIELWDF